MTSEAQVVVPDPSRLVSAMARHFGHKVPVERDGDRATIRLRMGDLGLAAADEGLRMRAEAELPEDLLRVQEVATDHLRRFARSPGLAVDWAASGA